MNRPLVAITSALAILAGCQAFKEAMSAHVDVAATAASQELSVERLSALLEKAKVPPTTDVARAIADLWVNYQLLGHAAASGDSLHEKAQVDSALWPAISQQRVAKWHDQLTKSFQGIDTTNLEARYASGEMLAARHILLTVPANATPAQQEAVRAKAQALRAQVTPANFGELARKNSQDPGSAARGGELGLFPKGSMVKEFQDALLKLKPGEISPVVKTQFGYHIIERDPYADVKEEFARAINAGALQHADSSYLAHLEATSNIKIRDNAVGVMRAAAKDLDAHRSDDAVLATSVAGPFTLGRLVHWIDAYPQRAQIEHGLGQAPDSQVIGFLQSVVRNELVLRQADSAKVQLDSSEMAELRSRFADLVSNAWDGLGVSPKTLADSGTSAAQRDRVAAATVDRYMDGLMVQQSRYVPVPQPLETVLRERFQWKINTAGVDRAVQQAVKERARADSAKARNLPSSAVPLGPPAAPKP